MNKIIYMALAAIFCFTFMVSANVSAQTPPANQPAWQTQVLQAQARGHQRALEDLYSRSRGTSSEARNVRTRLQQICTISANGETLAVEPSAENPCPALTTLQARLNSGEFVSTSDFAPFAEMIQAACSVTDPTESEREATCPRLDRIEADIAALEQYNQLVVAPAVHTVEVHTTEIAQLRADVDGILNPALRFGITFGYVGYGDDIDSGAMVGGGFGFRYRLRADETVYGVTAVRLGVSSEGWDFNPALTQTFLYQAGDVVSVGGGLSGSLDLGALNEGGLQAANVLPVAEVRFSFGKTDISALAGVGLTFTREGSQLGGEAVLSFTQWF